MTAVDKSFIPVESMSQGECEEVYPCSIFHKSFVWNM